MSADIPSNLTDAETARITVQVPLGVKEKLNEIAFEESSPNSRVSMSEVARHALTDYVQNYEPDEESKGAA